MSSEEEVSESKTIKEPEGGSKLLFGRDQPRAILEALGQLHAAGNPLVLHEVIRRSQEYDLPLPQWAAAALMNQEVALLNDPKRGKMGRYKQSLKIHVRRRTYRAIMRWLKDPRRYSGMPRTIIERWYAGAIQHKDKKSTLTKSKRAINLASEALRGTFAQISKSSLEEKIYSDPLKAQIDEILSEVAARPYPNALKPLEDRDRHEIEDYYRAKLGESWVFDEWEVEAEIGLLTDFFGPPGPPPPNIQAELDKLKSSQSDGGLFSEK